MASVDADFASMQHSAHQVLGVAEVANECFAQHFGPFLNLPLHHYFGDYGQASEPFSANSPYYTPPSGDTPHVPGGGQVPIAPRDHAAFDPPERVDLGSPRNPPTVAGVP